jgi:hypothetical protein
MNQRQAFVEANGGHPMEFRRGENRNDKEESVMTSTQQEGH